MSRQQVDLERAHFLVTQAFEEDEKGNDDEAIELYSQAVELCINTASLSLPLIDVTLSLLKVILPWGLVPLCFFLLCLQQSNGTSDQVLQTKLKQLAHQALERYTFHN